MKLVLLETRHFDLSKSYTADMLEQFGEVRIFADSPAHPKEVVLERIGDAEVVLTCKTRITRDMMEASPELKYIVCMSTGYNTVDIDAAKELGIVVSNVPGYGAYSVSQHAISLLLEIANHVGYHSEQVHKGAWESGESNWYYKGIDLYHLEGKTMGVIGYGAIGRHTGAIAQALGMKVLATDMYPDLSLESDTLRFVTKEELFAKSDVISLHTPYTPETHHIINKDSIAMMKDGVIIINTARGLLINEPDLIEAIKSRKVYAAGLDVLTHEPFQKNDPIFDTDNIFITAHMSSMDKESYDRLLKTTFENIEEYQKGNLIHVVNA